MAMAQNSPLRFGIRRAAGDPALVLAEIGWRWTFDGAALALVAYTVGRLLATTHLSSAELLALHSRTPVLIADAVAHILRDAWPRLAIAIAIVLPALAALWTLSAAAGRSATLRALLVHGRSSMRPLLGLCFLRAALALAAALAWVGAVIVAGLAAVRAEENGLGWFLLAFLPLGFLVGLCWSVLNWYLSLAPVFAVRDGLNSLSSIAEAARAVRKNRNAFSSVSSVFGFLHLFAFVTGTILALMPLALVGTFRNEIVLALMGLVALGYFALADFLYIARLAAYVRIVVDSDASSAAVIRPSVVSHRPEPGPAIDAGIPSAEG
ncbi:MAG: hypothetical protein L0212_04960 [Acidobacteria bacterium]|nr:hypothetical protein [Acidobacteriota bacterium]